MRYMALTLGFCFAFTLLPVGPAVAQSVTGTVPVAGETILNISATERTQVQQDLLMASLRAEHTGANAQAVQDQINRVMAAARAKAEGVSKTRISTGGYHVYQYSEADALREGKQAGGLTVWRGSQNLELESTDAAALLGLVGALQGMGMVMNNLSYTLSPDRADEAKDALMEKALAKVKARAERAARAMGKSRMDLVEITVDAADHAPPGFPAMRAMAMEGAIANMATPVAEPGSTDITLTVSARARLAP